MFAIVRITGFRVQRIQSFNKEKGWTHGLEEATVYRNEEMADLQQYIEAMGAQALPLPTPEMPGLVYQDPNEMREFLTEVFQALDKVRPFDESHARIKRNVMAVINGLP